VLFEGRPARGALVVFHPLDDPRPKAVKPRATVGRDGNFDLFTYSASDGAPAGNYAVSVVWNMRGEDFWETRTFDSKTPSPEWQIMSPDWKTKMAEWKTKGPPGKARGAGRARTSPRPNGTPANGMRPNRPAPLPPRYQNPQTSGLRVEVQPETNDLEPFKLTK
jgi:hypothetical protein